MNNQDKQVRNWKAIAATSVVVALAAVIALLVIGVKEFRDSFVKPAAESTVVTDATFAESSETEITEVTETTAEPEITETEVAEDIDYLSLWTSDAEAKKALVSYMEAITDENSPDYIPVEDRIAVFDMDGTILCETDPYYFDHCLLVYRVLEDPSYKNKASAFEKDVATRLQAKFDGDKTVEVSRVEHGQAVASRSRGYSRRTRRFA